MTADDAGTRSRSGFRPGPGGDPRRGTGGPGWSSWQAWRRSRPFWGGLLLVAGRP